MSRPTLYLFIAALTMLRSFSAASETVPLERQGGIYRIPVQVNGSLVRPFILDTGASSVVLPIDVFLTLIRTGAVTSSDFIGTGTATLADGSKHATNLYVLREVRVGHHTARNVVASVMPVNGEPLLGQTFLSKLPGWSIDNAQQALVITDGAGATQSLSAAPTKNPGIKSTRHATVNSSPTSSLSAVGHYGAIAWDENTGNRG